MAFGTLVQHKSATGSSLVPAAVFTSPPASGNLLVADVSVNGAVGSPTLSMTSAGWTALTAAGNTTRAVRKFWKPAGGSESSTVTAASSATGAWTIDIAEYATGGLTINAPTESSQMNISGTSTTPIVTPTAGLAALVHCFVGENVTSTYSAQKVNASATGVNVEESPTRATASGTMFDLVVASTSGTYQGSATPGTASAGQSAIAVFTTPAITFTDAPTGALTLAGSVAEAKTNADTQTGALVLAGSVTQSKTGTDSQTGALILAGSVTESKRGTDSQTGALILGGSCSEHLTRSSTPSGAFTLTGSCTQALSHAGAPAGALVLTGTVSEARLGSNSVTGALVLAGTVIESYIPGVTGVQARVGLTSSPTVPAALAELLLTSCAIADAPTTPVALAETVLTACALSDAPTAPVALSDAPLD